MPRTVLIKALRRTPFSPAESIAAMSAGVSSRKRPEVSRRGNEQVSELPRSAAARYPSNRNFFELDLEYRGKYEQYTFHVWEPIIGGRREFHT